MKHKYETLRSKASMKSGSAKPPPKENFKEAYEVDNMTNQELVHAQKDLLNSLNLHESLS